MCVCILNCSNHDLEATLSCNKNGFYSKKNLNYHSSNKDDDVDPTCRTCGKAKEEFIHVATECDPILGQARATMPSLHGEEDGWDVDELVNFLNLDRVHHLMTTRLDN